MPWSAELRNVLSVMWVSVTLPCKVSHRCGFAFITSGGNKAQVKGD